MYILCETMLNKFEMIKQITAVYCVFRPFRCFGPVPELRTCNSGTFQTVPELQPQTEQNGTIGSSSTVSLSRHTPALHQPREHRQLDQQCHGHFYWGWLLGRLLRVRWVITRSSSLPHPPHVSLIDCLLTEWNPFWPN